jgi:dTMP kinase
MVMAKGKFVVFEGMDGSGKDTQIGLLCRFLDVPFETLRYPDPDRPIGSLIRQFLARKYEFTPEMQMLLYGGEMASDAPRIRVWKEQGKTVIANRYFTSTMAFQSSQGVPLEKFFRFAELMEMPKPDRIIYLKISPETSVKRTKGKDRFDVLEFQRKVEKSYEALIKDDVFGPWYVVDAERPVEDVFAQVRKALGLPGR